MKKQVILWVCMLLSLTASAQINHYQNSSREDVKAFWENVISTNKNYKKNIVNNSKQIRSLRSSFNENSQLAVNEISNNSGFYEDDIFLNDYLTNIVQMLSGGFNNQTRSLATAKIMLEVSPNACAYPNGTLVFNTRLLSMMECEEELIGVVAHELSHYMLEHALTNYVAMEKKAKKAKTWAGIAAAAGTIVGAAAEAVGGDGTGTGVIAGAELGLAIGGMIEANLENLGYKFSQEQELEADRVATELMEQIGVSKTYYASALDKLRQEDYRFGREIVKTKKKSTHPALDERIMKIGGEIAEVQLSTDYTKKIAQVLTIDAYLEKEIHKDHERALLVFDRIETATELSFEDYLIKIPVLLDMYNSREENLATLKMLQHTMNEYKHEDILSLSKYEAMIYVRLKDVESAQNSLNTYISYCDAAIEKSNKDAFKRTLEKERSWAENTLRRL